MPWFLIAPCPRGSASDVGRPVKRVPRITQIDLGEPSASIRHQRSSQRPPEGETQDWTLGDRGNPPSHGYLVN
jgi:hypothetical protein